MADERPRTPEAIADSIVGDLGREPDRIEHLPTPNEATRQLVALAKEYNRVLRQYGEVQKVAAAARSDAVKAEAQAFLTAEGAMDMRKWQARLDASDELFQADLAERIVYVIRERMRHLEIRIEVGRTIAATAREEFRGLPGEGTGS